MNEVEVLILSSRVDFSTDLVCYRLEQKRVKYLRLNRDQFSGYQIIYDLVNASLKVAIEDSEYNINAKSLKSIYFRAPVYLRNGRPMSVDEQLSREQWNAFLRNMVVFDRVKWVNNPVSTYRAENKMLQLQTAAKLGINIPETFVGNCVPNHVRKDSNYIVKSLDTALLYDGQTELFAYTNIVSGKELLEAEISTAPVIIQELLEDKIDLRVTVVGNQVFPARILSQGKGIYGDWRRNKKEDLQYIPTELPEELKTKLVRFVRKMDLCFAGIDLAISSGKYYFIESNPTGEWGWLVKTTHFPIDVEIANQLAEK